ncbi:hypothetical protein KCU77_g293, partial [Aureobasidium melanogenum]
MMFDHSLRHIFDEFTEHLLKRNRCQAQSAAKIRSISSDPGQSNCLPPFKPHAQVRSPKDTVIQVDWSFTTGQNRGTTKHKRWLYFQDGAAFVLPSGSPTKVLARYSHNGDVASTLNAFGKGWVANVGPHPEADPSWYDLVSVRNPDGVKTDIGVDFVRAALNAASDCTADPRMARLTALRELIAASNL